VICYDLFICLYWILYLNLWFWWVPWYFIENLEWYCCVFIISISQLFLEFQNRTCWLALAVQVLSKLFKLFHTSFSNLHVLLKLFQNIFVAPLQINIIFILFRIYFFRTNEHIALSIFSSSLVIINLFIFYLCLYVIAQPLVFIFLMYNLTKCWPSICLRFFLKIFRFLNVITEIWNPLHSLNCAFDVF